MKKKITAGTIIRALSVNMAVVGTGMLICSSLVAVVGCVVK